MMTPDELKAAFAALPLMEPVKPAHTWAFWAWDLRQNVQNNEPTDFLNWPGVVGTMFVGNAPYIKNELSDLPFEYLVNLEDPGIGNPNLYEIDENVKPSGNLIHQAYHLSQWEEKTQRHISDIDTIVEVGGGYGAMALIVHRLGFKGRYIILDLPEFSLLQQYYLSNVGVDWIGLEFYSEIYEHFNADLLIGLYSLNEMPLKERARIIQLCPAKSYLIAYGASWGGIDNGAWAREFMAWPGYVWHNWNIPHLPNCWYLVGDKQE